MRRSAWDSHTFHSRMKYTCVPNSKQLHSVRVKSRGTCVFCRQQSENQKRIADTVVHWAERRKANKKEIDTKEPRRRGRRRRLLQFSLFSLPNERGMNSIGCFFSVSLSAWAVSLAGKWDKNNFALTSILHVCVSTNHHFVTRNQSVLSEPWVVGARIYFAIIDNTLTHSTRRRHTRPTHNGTSFDFHRCFAEQSDVVPNSKPKLNELVSLLPRRRWLSLRKTLFLPVVNYIL